MRSTKFRIAMIAVILLVILASLGVLTSLAQTVDARPIKEDRGAAGPALGGILLPAISLIKTVGTDANVCATTSLITVVPGTQVTYCYEVTNTGDLVFGLHDLQDSELGSILNGFSYSLLPGASVFLTATIQITETTVNTATWTAYNPGPIDVSTATDSATVEVLQPAISLNKTVGTDANVCATTSLITVMPGTQVTYCYEVTNTGDLTLGLHDLQDSQLGSVRNGLAYSLMPGASAFLTATVEITETIVNTATWTAYNPGPTDVSTATDSATVEIFKPEISLNKTVGTDANACASANQITVMPGTQVTYCYEVTNTGNLAFSLHDLQDSQLGSLLNGLSYSLMPGASTFLTATVQITETTVNTATWMAYNPGPTDEASAQAEARVVAGMDLYLYLPFIRK